MRIFPACLWTKKDVKVVCRNLRVLYSVRLFEAERTFVPELSFDDLAVDPAIRQGISDLGYLAPLEVQIQTIEPLRQGRCLSVRSRTGTGKTAAFGIPLLEKLDPNSTDPSLLVLTPTRELAAQVAGELTALGRHRGIRVLSGWGGVSLGSQIKALKQGGQTLVGTPGRLLDLIRRKVLRLDRVGAVVLDEADEMLSMGFLEDVSKIMDGCKQCHQVVILSASLSEDTERLIAKYTKDVVRLDLSADQLSVEGIQNVYYEIGDDLPKHHYLMHLLAFEKPASAIVFVNTRSDASLVATLLAREGYRAEMISGELPQTERERVMGSIRNGDLRFLVATDLAARGIDISHLTHVINYSLPEDPALYLHRVGRTGRVGRQGTAISLLSGRDVRTLPQIQRVYGVSFTERQFPQASEMVKERNNMKLETLIQAAEQAICDGFVSQAKAILEHPKAEQIVGFLLKRHADQVHDEQRSAANRPERKPSRPGFSRHPRRH
jgi:ATP-dependent RNA helicase DeaD